MLLYAVHQGKSVLELNISNDSAHGEMISLPAAASFLNL